MKTRVRAIIVERSQILLIHRVKDGMEYWVFPGGGVEESDKSTTHALERECLEELGVAIRIGKLFVDESKGDTRELFYLCEIQSGRVGSGDGPEFHECGNYHGTYEVQWISVAELDGYDVKPETVKKRVIGEVI